jgi:hypothetical protein
MRSVKFGVASVLVSAASFVGVASCRGGSPDEGPARSAAFRSQPDPGSGAPHAVADSGAGGGSDPSPSVQGPYPDGIVFGEQTRLRGHVSCADLGLGTVSTTIDGADVKGGATFPLADSHSVTLFDDSVTAHQVEPPFRDLSYFQFFFEATLGIDAVIVQGGPDSLVNEYCPSAKAALGLVAPFQCFSNDGVPTGDDFDASGCDFGLPYAILRVELCYRLDGLTRACTAKTW